MEKWAAEEWQKGIYRKVQIPYHLPFRLPRPCPAFGNSKKHPPLSCSLGSFLSPLMAFILHLNLWHYLASQVSPDLICLQN